MSFLNMGLKPRHSLGCSHFSYKALCEVDKELADYLEEDYRLYLNDLGKM